MGNHLILYHSKIIANEIKEEEWSVLTGIPPYLISYPTKY